MKGHADERRAVVGAAARGVDAQLALAHHRLI